MTDEAPVRSRSRNTTIRTAHAWQEYLNGKREEYGVPGLAVAVADRERILLAAVAGVRTLADDAPVEVDDAFHIGSITKPMTATLVARLVEAGALDWRTTPGDVWPGEASAFHPDPRRVTLEQLLSHQAGMPSFESDEENETFPRHDESARDERARFARWLLQRPPTHPIGEYAYSNAGYGLVAAMIERATGASWEELMTREVFRPLGLTSAGFGWPADEPGHPHGHRLRDGRLQPHDRTDGYRLRACIAPAGDVHASVGDLARFGQTHMRGLRAESDYLTRRTFRTLHEAPDGGYALGWNIRSTYSHHLGSAGTFDTCLIVFPTDDLVVVVATNSYGVMTPTHVTDVASHLYRSFRPRP